MRHKQKEIYLHCDDIKTAHQRAESLKNISFKVFACVPSDTFDRLCESLAGIVSYKTIATDSNYTEFVVEVSPGIATSVANIIADTIKGFPQHEFSKRAIEIANQGGKMIMVGLDSWFTVRVEISGLKSREFSDKLISANTEHVYHETEGEDSIFKIEAWLPNLTEIYEIIKTVI